MPVLVYLFELLVGLLTVLAIAVTMWFAGVYIICGLILAMLGFVLWAFGNSIVKAFKGLHILTSPGHAPV